MNRKDFPKIHFYDQDFVDIYNKTWNWLGDFWIDPKSGEPSADGYFVYPEDQQYVLNYFSLYIQTEIILQTRILIIYTHARKKTALSDGNTI